MCWLDSDLCLLECPATRPIEIRQPNSKVKDDGGTKQICDWTAQYTRTVKNLQLVLHLPSWWWLWPTLFLWKKNNSENQQLCFCSNKNSGLLSAVSCGSWGPHDYRTKMMLLNISLDVMGQQHNTGLTSPVWLSVLATFCLRSLTWPETNKVIMSFSLGSKKTSMTDSQHSSVSQVYLT